MFPSAGDRNADIIQPVSLSQLNDRQVLVDKGPFQISIDELAELHDPKNLTAFRRVGGLFGLTETLHTDTRTGISLDETTLDSHQDVVTAPESKEVEKARRPSNRGPSSSQSDSHSKPYEDRIWAFGTNRLPERKSKHFFHVMWDSFNDKVLILLTVVAVISLALGLYQSFGQTHEPGQPRVEWVEGVTIMVAVVVIVLVSALNDFQKEKQFVRLNKEKEDRNVKAIRSGKSLEISIYDVLVGDVLHLEPGDVIPADGIYISGYSIKCDESSITGESNHVKKTPGEEAFGQIDVDRSSDQPDPFLVSGSKVLEGVGTFLVTATGAHSSHGRLINALTKESEETPLQKKLLAMAQQITKWGGLIALLLFIILFIKFLVQLKDSTDSASDKGQSFLKVLIISITVLVIAVPEGLPLAVTLTLAVATKRMLKDNNLVRILSACETMGNATVICTDKTGTLTMNQMEVVTATVGLYRGYKKSGGWSDKITEAGGPSTEPSADPEKHASSELLSETKLTLTQAIAVNSTAFESQENGKTTFVGSRTETALLSFAKAQLGMGSVSVERSNSDIVKVVPFDSSRKCMASVIKLHDGRFRLLVNGASEILFEKCNRVFELEGTGAVDFTAESRELLRCIIDRYASQSLRTISIIYRDFSEWPPIEAEKLEDDPTRALFEDVFKDMTFLAVVGIQDPLRPGVAEAISHCRQAGVIVKMVTGDNLKTAKVIAEECGIFDGGVVMEGPEFRRLSQSQMDEVTPRLQVLARSSPEDKRILVKRLKELGETVAVTGDGTNDGPALSMADVGFAMGITGTEIAKEASSIILMDDNFLSIVKAIRWGRAVNDAVKRFIQFQLTVNVTAVVLTFVTAIASDTQQSVLTPVQLLWVNLVQDTFAAIALATDPPSPTILDRKPDRKSAPIISFVTWKMILGQSLYQLIVTLILNFAGTRIFGYSSTHQKDQLQTLIFNIYVWMQIFNQYNNRRLDNKFNILEGIHRNAYFIGISLLQIAGQIIIVFKGGLAFSATPLSGMQWGVSLAFGAGSLPVAVLIRLLPDEKIQRRLAPFKYGWAKKREG